MPGTENKLYLASQVQEVPLEMLPQNMQSSSHLSESKNKFKKKIFFFFEIYTYLSCYFPKNDEIAGNQNLSLKKCVFSFV